MENLPQRVVTTAILVDGAFYIKRAYHYLGYVSAQERAQELIEYCHSLLHADKNEQRNLYRIFYYDCPPVNKNVFHPLTRKVIELGKTDDYKWMNEFQSELKHKRKVALRLGRINESDIRYTIKPNALNALLQGQKQSSDLTLSDFEFNAEQKGVDMRIGIDISSLAFKKQVDQIILISGDSDFVPAAKHARREGIDFLLNPLGLTVKPELYEHIDGLINWVPRNARQSQTNDTDETITV